MDGHATEPFPYMRWAKRHLSAFSPMNLGMSGRAALTSADLPFPAGVPYWAPEGEYGDPGLRAAIAARYGVAPERVFASAGTSLANFLVFLSEARGGHVAVETPAYEALVALPSSVCATVSTFRRVEERQWRIDPDSLRAAAKPGTRLLVVSDLHNPSGKHLHPDDLALLVSTAERLDAAVLVDEVYLDLAIPAGTTSALSSDRILATNSLTKAHGLGGLRVGWILASPERIARIAAWNDLVCPAHPVPSVEVAKAYFPVADRFLGPARAAFAERLSRTDAWVRSRGDVTWVRPDGGLTGFLRLPSGMDGDRLAEVADREHGVRVVPGSFFQSPGHVRLSFGLPVSDLDRALAALGRAIDQLASGPR